MLTTKPMSPQSSLNFSVMVMVHRSSSATVTAGEISTFWTSSSSTASSISSSFSAASRSFFTVPDRSLSDLVKTRLPSSSSRMSLPSLSFMSCDSSSAVMVTVVASFASHLRSTTSRNRSRAPVPSSSRIRTQWTPQSSSIFMYSSVSSSPSTVPPESSQLPTKLALGSLPPLLQPVRAKASARTHVRNASTDFLNVVFMVSSFLCENP